MGLEAGQHQPQEPEFALAALETNEPPVCVNVERLRSQTFEQGRDMSAGEGLVVDGAVERAHPGGVPVIVDDLRIRAAREQGFDQRDVAGACGEHQRGGAAIGLVVDAVQVAILQHGLCGSFEKRPQLPRAHRRRRARRAAHRVAGIFRESGNLGELDELAFVKDLRDAGQQLPAVGQRQRRREIRFGEPFDIGALSVPQRIIEQGLFGLGGRILGIERLGRPFPQGLQRPGRPWRRPRGQKRFPDRARLLLLALQFELAGLLRPFVLARRRSRQSARYPRSP